MPKKKTTTPPVLTEQVRTVTSAKDLPSVFRMWEKMEEAIATGKVVYYYKAPVGNYYIIATEEALDDN